MATISSPSLFLTLLRTPSPPSFASLRFARNLSASPKLTWKPLEASRRVVKAVAEETEGLVSEGGDEIEEESVSVQVSPSDMLFMHFKAEGTMNEGEIPTVERVLEGETGISDVDILCTDGAAIISLTKETTVQATGVASGLVELLQRAGFKLQSLSLSFEDEEDEIEKSQILVEAEDDEDYD